MKQYPKYTTKALYRISERKIINLTGCKIPSYGSEDYFQLICILFIPWRTYADLNPDGSTWEQIYHESNIYIKYNLYLRHWNMLNECYDEKDDVYKQRQLLLQAYHTDYNPNLDISTFTSEIMEGVEMLCTTLV